MMLENRCAICRCAICNSELETVFKIRHEVFVDEQGVPVHEERDQYDSISRHIICLCENNIVGCGRLYTENDVAHIGRICILKPYRGLGIGTSLCEYLCQLAFSLSCKTIELNAQIQALEFYQRLGFQIIGTQFMDAGIPHMKMIKSTYA